MNRFAKVCCVTFVCFGFAGCPSRHDPLLDSFQIHPDFEIALVAKEPVVLDPIDMEFDEHGRAFVVEMPGYPFMEEKGRVILLEDKNRDGVYDQRHVFCEGLNFADAILPYRGGLLVAAPPDLVFIKDTNGDNVADVREVWLTGFAVENPQHNFNGLTHGLDNWIYGANGGNSGNVYWPGDSLHRIPLRDDDFRMNFDVRKFERIGVSAGGYGFAFDEWGRIYGFRMRLKRISTYTRVKIKAASFVSHRRRACRACNRALSATISRVSLRIWAIATNGGAIRRRGFWSSDRRQRQ